MKRDYATGEADDAVFFTGTEVEHTPAHGMFTLFVTGVQPIEEIEQRLTGRHIFFGANHSFNPGVNFPEDAPAWEEWEEMILYFLKKGVMCSLDLPYDHSIGLLESALVEHHNFIPQIRIVLPYIQQYGYNTMIKIDDRGFNETNPGVWCHSLHDLMDRKKFTDWSQYGLDKILK